MQLCFLHRDGQSFVSSIRQVRPSLVLQRLYGGLPFEVASFVSRGLHFQNRNRRGNQE